MSGRTGAAPRPRTRSLGDARRYVLALDQGTTGIDGRWSSIPTARCAGAGTPSLPQHFPKPGWVEHDPEEIWRTTCEAPWRRRLSAAHVSPTEIAAVGITNQRETTILWERASGRPVGNAIVWQCRRTAALCEALKSAGAPSPCSGRRPVSSWIPISPAPRSAGSSTRFRESGLAPSEERSRSAPWTRGCSGDSAAAPSTRPIRRTPRARCASISARSTGTRDCAGASACRCPSCRASCLPPASSPRPSTACPARRHPGGGNRGRPAGGPLRSGLPGAGNGQEHVRHRMLRAPQHGIHARRLASAGS